MGVMTMGILIKCDTSYDANLVRMILTENKTEHQRFAERYGDCVYIYVRTNMLAWTILKKKLEKEFLAGANFEVLVQM